jgi:hypothetical protein
MHEKVAVLKICKQNIFNLNVLTKLHEDFLLVIDVIQKGVGFRKPRVLVYKFLPVMLSCS